MSKIDVFKSFTQKKQIFACPICKKELLVDNNSLVCSSKHSFDISKKGYVNFVLNQKNTSYNKELFSDRKIIFENGFFDTLNKTVAKLISEEKKEGIILDAGCGEGSNLNCIVNTCLENHIGIGLDIAKDGIALANQNSKTVFVVADLAKLPISDNSVDFVINILTPANYSEFTRVLNNGALIKVLPGANYLRQLREVAFKEDKKIYSNDKTVEYFNKHFKDVSVYDCCYDFKIDNTILKHLLNMTPLLWNLKDRHEIFFEPKIDYITCDFKILVGRMV